MHGTFTWHKHDDEDEFFLVMKGQSECWILLIEPMETKHTGDVVSELTRSIEDQLG